MKPLTMIAFFIFTLFFSPVYAETNIPHMINYQGRLTDSNGNNMITKDYTLSFSIYSDANAVTPVWGPQIFDGKIDVGHGGKVPVVRGYFNVILGLVDVNNIPIIQAFENFSETYVEISFFENNEFIPVFPRQIILSSPYAMVAENANHAKVADRALSADLALHHSNTLPVGTIVPFFGESAPLGWLFCDGSMITEEEKFLQLKMLLGNNKLPDLKNVFLDKTTQLYYQTKNKFELSENLCIKGKSYSSHGESEFMFDNKVSTRFVQESSSLIDFWCAYMFNKDTIVNAIVLVDPLSSFNAHIGLNVIASNDSLNAIDGNWEVIDYDIEQFNNNTITYYHLNNYKQYKIYKISLKVPAAWGYASIEFSDILMKTRVANFHINHIIKY